MKIVHLSLIDKFRLMSTVGWDVRNADYTTDEFISAAERAVKEHPNEWVIFYMLGDVYQEVGRYADALSACKRCVELRPHDIRSVYALATAYNVLTRAAWTDWKVASWLRGLSQQMGELAKGELVKCGLDLQTAAAQAIYWFQKALCLKPDAQSRAQIEQDLQTLFRLRNLLEGLEKVVEAYDKSIEMNPEDAKAWYNKGAILEYRGRYEEAIRAYDKAIELNPECAEFWSSKGAILYWLGRYEEAVRYVNKAISIDPEYAEAWYNKGVVLAKLGRHEEAVGAYDKAIKINPEHAEAWHNKGIALRYLGRYDEAERAFNTATEINSKVY